jgi:pyruvate dehydrogenase E1 component
MSGYYQDPDPQETRDWLDSLDGVVTFEGGEKADYLLTKLTDRAREKGVATSPGVLTPYTNTMVPADEDTIPGESLIEIGRASCRERVS